MMKPAKRIGVSRCLPEMPKIGCGISGMLDRTTIRGEECSCFQSRLRNRLQAQRAKTSGPVVAWGSVRQTSGAVSAARSRPGPGCLLFPSGPREHRQRPAVPVPTHSARARFGGDRWAAPTGKIASTIAADYGCARYVKYEPARRSRVRLSTASLHHSHGRQSIRMSRGGKIGGRSWRFAAKGLKTQRHLLLPAILLNRVLFERLGML